MPDFEAISSQLVKMYTPSEAAALEKLNYYKIREMIRATWTVGYNMKKPTRWDILLQFWSIVLIAASLASFYGHYQLFIRFIHDIPRISETISTVFQCTMAIMKMVYFLLAPRKFYVLLRRACSHEMLLNCELFRLVADLPIARPLRQHIESIMNRCWISKRRQLLYYLFACSCILINYFVTSLVINLYRSSTHEQNDFEVVLPIPSLYPGWMDKGITFPYFHIPLIFETANLYLCGMGTLGFDVLFIVLCQHGVGLMQSLSHMIECSTSSLVPQEMRVEYMRCCIYQYQRVAAYALELNNTFRHIIIIQFLLSLFCWGLILFQMSVGIATSMTTTLRMFMYLAAGGYQIVIYCYNGQLFATASERIPKAFYNCLWYAESREFRQLIRMMIMRSNQTFSLDVSWFTKMSLPTLLSMVRTSGQYFLLLQNITQK
ncbi:odorant receptor 63a [Drosophila albomicans]|uniref:Odorant receptor n=1 Tax=Drosophila albomicans TaxID=7291 RepID=A0A6P8X0X7_DROAB|nr:odorant receptor 63a [Drosophila albomicans]